MKPMASTPTDLAAAIRTGGSGKRSLRYISAGLLVLVVGGGVWFAVHRIRNARSGEPAFSTEVLQRGDIRLAITATGNLAPTTEVTVGGELSGTTLEVYVDFNDRVSKGTPLAKLDTSKLAQQTEISRAAVRSAQARVAQAEATAKESAAALARDRQLSQAGLVSPADLEVTVAGAGRAEADLLSAKATVGEADAQVRINEFDLSKAIIQSPIDGIVLIRSIEPGQTVAASFTAPQLFVIAEKLERMKLKVTIAEADIGRVAPGQASTFTVDAWPDRTYTARVSIVQDLDTNERSLLRRYALGFVFQGFNLLPRTSSLDNVELPLLYRGVSRKERREKAVAALTSVGLPTKMDSTPAELSGGQQQRVAIARAIVTEPSTLFADEPTGNLDSVTTGDVMELLKRLNEDNNFNIFDTRQIAETLGSTTQLMTLLLAAVAGVSLLVGGIGIMNIMLVSVTERTREIGIRLAIGATAREVLLQFLIEAVTLSCVGGMVGILLAFGLCAGLARLIQVPFNFNVQINVIAFVFAAVVGVLFGYAPARRAARLNPIDALRNE